MQYFYSKRGIPNTQPLTPFQGSPNVTITAIDTSGGIAVSRASGQTPCFVHVSASAITATGTSKPYEDLEFQWDFGDPSGTETFTNPVTGAGVNMNTCQYGGEATYCYRTAGTKTITLTVRGRSGGGFTPSGVATASASVTTTISVSAFSASGGEFWFDQVNGSDSNNGTSSGTPKQSLTALNALVASNTSFHLSRGSNWTGTTGILFPTSAVSGVRFDAYGSGANPIININGPSGGPTSFPFYCNNGASHVKNDIVLSNITLKVTSGSNTLACSVIVTTLSSAIIQDIYFDHVDQTATINVSGLDDQRTSHWEFSTGGTMFNNGMWGGSITSPQTIVSGGNVTGHFGGAQNWFFMIGVAMSGGSNSTDFDHHIYPNCQNHVHFRYMNFGNGPGRGYCINSNFDPVGGPTPDYAQYWLFSENYFSGTLLGHDLSNGSNAVSSTRFKNVVTQQNAFTNLQFGMLYYCAETHTIRDNLVWGLSSEFFVPDMVGLAAILTPQLYRNKIYSTVNPAIGNPFIGNNATAVAAKWVVTDNVSYDTNVSTVFWDAVVSSYQSNSALIDRNQWYAPNDSDQKFLGSTPITFAAWQADGFDVNGSVANPNWLDPANGKFG